MAGARAPWRYNRVYKWRQVPALRRGQLIRRLGDALRAHQKALSGLIALESGKIKAEGKVQEMIGIAELAVGQSRMLYGCTMHSERPRHYLQTLIRRSENRG